MGNATPVRIGLALAAWAGAASASAQPIGTRFTYQGRLADGGSPANGAYDLQLALFDALAGGAQVSPLLSRDDVSVTDGLFTVTLDFGAAFGGSARWIELRVRPGASTGAYTTLSPRQELTASPYALFTTVAPWTGIAGKPAGFADDVDDDALGALSCGSGQVARWNGSAWTCVADSGHNHLAQTWAGSGLGLHVESTGADGLQGASSAAGANGVLGLAQAPTGRGVMGVNSASSGFAFGVMGQTDSTSGRGVFGSATASTGANFGVRGQTVSSQGIGVFGHALATEGSAHGVRGETQSSIGRGVWGFANTAAGVAYGVFGESGSESGRGVHGRATAEFGGTVGVEGESASPSGIGVLGTATATDGIGVGVRGTTTAPAGQGVAGRADNDGEAEVRLPDWFEALNRDFRYQLTAIGQPGPGLHVAMKVMGNRFRIGGGSPGMEVSWQVTGIRHDAYAERHRIPVEQDKPPADRGRYLQPEAHGQPADKGVDATRPGRLPSRPMPRRPPVGERPSGS